MRTPTGGSRARLAALAALGGLLFGVAGCGGGGPEDAKPDGKASSWGRVCGGIVSSETKDYLLGRASDSAGKVDQAVYELPVGHGGDAFRDAAKDLLKGPGASRHDDVCRLWDKKGDGIIRLAFYWDLDDYSVVSKPSRDGRVQRLSKTFAVAPEAGYSTLSIDCRRPGHVEPGGYPATLHASLVMPDGDMRAQTQVFYAAARKVLPALHCTNDVTVPTALPTRDPRLK
ncbi:hypothetical protein [Streptomyces sp. NBC_01497]|uniref:hypothetical protein n=1 Tax=Streptomyces sp. NBC_01497 TaxID=2903885 RepID=UPI002E373815|nr:hypothetical protein [Streptomyces sp. NBC_01497]